MIIEKPKENIFNLIKSHCIKYKVITAEGAPFLLDDVKDIEEFQSSGTLIKDDRSTRITYVSLPASKKPVIAKKFKFKGWLHSIIRSIGKSRARTYWTGANEMLKTGISTPVPYAVIEKKLGPITIDSYIITEFYNGENAKKFIEKTVKYSNRELHIFVESALHILKTMFNNGITHGDTKVPNFMIKNNDVCIVDLDVVKIHKTRNSMKKHIKKDIDRFERDWDRHSQESEVIPKINQLRQLFLS